MSLMSPTWKPPSVTAPANATNNFETEKLSLRVKSFTSKMHWEISHSLTTNHLLTIVALANTLMSMQNATFVPEQERVRRANRFLCFNQCFYYSHNDCLLDHLLTIHKLGRIRSKTAILVSRLQRNMAGAWSQLFTASCFMTRLQIYNVRNSRSPWLKHWQ